VRKASRRAELGRYMNQAVIAAVRIATIAMDGRR
jgi:hypothetical protein